MKLDNLSFHDSPPLVSIAILTCRRWDELKKAVESALAQDYSNKEILVVDNGSGDGTAENVATHYPQVKVLSLPENLGACAGRNAGVRAAQGEIVVTIDDDVYFDRSNAVGTVIDAFRKYPEVACFVFRVMNIHTGSLDLRCWAHSRNYGRFAMSSFETDAIVEGFCAFRKSIFQNVGGYYEPLFIYGEGGDLAYRIYDAGYKVVYYPEVVLWHSANPTGRNCNREVYFLTRNEFWVAWRHLSLLQVLRSILIRLLTMAYISLTRGHIPSFMSGIKDGLLGIIRGEHKRVPISIEAEKRLRSIWQLDASAWEKYQQIKNNFY